MNISKQFRIRNFHLKFAEIVTLESCVAEGDLLAFLAKA
jgi:hypothetical protein